MTAPNPFSNPGKRQYRAWSVRTVVVQLSRKLKATYRIRGERCLSRLLAAMLAGMTPWALADLPTGLNVVAGQATASMPTANSMRINQATDKAVLNWQTFNIGVGQSVQFVQPAATSVALNRIVGNEASSIYGSLSANGQVFLVNPSGVMFAPGAQVNVGGLVASSLAIGNEDFMAGRYTFSGLGGGSVENNGTINAARGGYVLLAAPKVTNTGSINADAGSVGLVAGSRATLDTSGMGLVRFSVDAAAANAAITNSGSIAASGGQVAVLASAAGDALATVINQTGVIRANSAVERNGMIVLSGGQTGVVRVAGALSSTGTAPGQTGGTVQVLGDKVLLAPGASIDASGPSGGGTVLVGGDYQGLNASVQNASRVHVAAGTNLSADATSSGNGGKVVVWADGDTRFAGTISARGGAQGGNGGFVEVSGKRDLEMQGRIDVAAPQGIGGNVLLDPQDIVLSTAANNPGAVTNQPVSTPDLAFGDAPVAGTYTVNIASVTGFNELFLQATNNITVSNAIAMGAGNSIRLEANNNIAVNAGITVTGAGGITLKADADTSGAGSLTMTNAALASNAGGITLSGASVSTSNAASTIISTGAANGNGGNVSITATAGAVNLVGAITANGGTTTSVGRDAGNVTIAAQTGIATAGITASGTAGAAGNNNGGTAGQISLTNNTSGAITTTGALTSQTGSATGIGSAGNAGFITVTNNAAGQNVTTSTLLTTGGAKGLGGNITVSAAGAGVLSTGGAAITTTGGVGVSSAGANAGNITLSGGTVTMGASVLTATGGAGNGTSFAGGSGGTISVTSNAGGMTNTGVGAMTANGGAASATAAAGGAAGFITVTNAAASAGAISLAGSGGLNARTGASTGTTAAFAAGSITVNNNATAATATTIGALSTAGNPNGNGGLVSITTTGTLALAGANASNGAGGTVRGDVTLLSGGAITQSGAIVTRNLSATTASAGGAAITLNNTGNDAVAVNLQVKDGTTAAPGTNNVNAAISYTDSNAVAVSSINSGTGGSAGDVTLLAGGALTQTGAIKAATLAATTANTTAITLTNTGNDAATVNLQARTGTVAAPGTVNANVAVQYTDANGFAISGISNGASGTAGALTLIASGSITQTGAVNTSALNATLTGGTSALNLGTQANNIAQLNAITAPGGITLTNGNNSVIVNGNITATNNAVSIDAGTGGYTQNNVDISAGSGPITLVANTVAIAANTGNNALITSGTLTLKPKTAGQAMSLAGASAFDLSAAEITAISTGATGPIVIGDTASTGVLTIGAAVNLTGKTLTLNAGSITDAGVQTITAQNVTLNANGQIGTSNANGIDVAATNLNVNTSGNANAFVRTGAINMGVGSGGSSLGTGTLDLTATGAVTQTAGTGNITAGTLNVKTLANAGAAITLTNSANDTAVINLKTRDLADAGNAAGVIQYSDATGFDVATIATTGNATLSATGAVTQSGAIAATGLALTGTGGAYTLNNAGNAITTLAANTGSINYKQGGALFVGTVGVAGVTTTGSTGIETTGAASNLTLNNAVTSGATGDAVVLKAGSGNAAGVSTGGQLINNVGTGGIVASSGRYLAYSGNPDFTTEGVTGYAKRYNADATFVPAGTSSTFVYRIAPTLTVTANAGNKVYDGAAPTLTFGTAGLIDGDTAGTVLSGALTRTGGKNVLGGDAVTIGTLATQMGYGITYTGANYSITAKALTATASAPSKAYDGNNSAAATLSITAGLVGTETVTATGGATFNSKNVVGASLVTVNSTTLADGTNGGLASNYSLAAGQTVAANITAKALTATASATNKVYDGNTTAAATLAIAPAGFVGAETVTATAAATFNAKDVASANLVTVNSTTLADGTNGGLATNYSLAAGQTALANISRANIANVGGITAANKVQDGTTAATLSTGNAAFTGKVAGDTLTVATANGTFDTAAVGTGKLVSISGITLGGTDAGNYTLVSSTASTTANILRLGTGTSTGSFPDGALAGAANASLITDNWQRGRDQRCAVASRDGGDSAADTGARRLSSDLTCD